MKLIFKTAFLNALATATYVSIVGFCLFYAGKLKLGQTPTPLVPIFMLLLMVFSAALTGTLIFGKPVLWYMEGKKKEALLLLMYTLGTFFMMIVLAFIGLLIWKI